MKKIILLSLLPLLLTSCGKADYTDKLNRSYDSYTEFKLTNIKDQMFTQNNDKYFVYIYRPPCGGCIDIKGALLDYLDSSKVNNLEYKPYIYEWQKKIDIVEFKGSIYNSDYVIDLIRSTIGASNTKDVYIYGTPALYLIENNKLKDYIYLTSDIGEWLVKHK